MSTCQSRAPKSHNPQLAAPTHADKPTPPSAHRAQRRRTEGVPHHTCHQRHPARSPPIQS
ncbi:uncharacterized protein BDZ83DRAFT_605782 [Colletotrichum acutatum]|uniref:Uncharacterized protein n=1 Tax=Glomerella acutata TaxID=27357 RepID=A0AAD8XKU8_GLOAC|nr:uncharacterized protein BDZ83DRAFT_605782 [Colletotrichum acutatum]KAK1729230.1 hypothetical protein BDZ83DRAFT_605782 [Colletotrichum acutatum]